MTHLEKFRKEHGYSFEDIRRMLSEYNVLFQNISIRTIHSWDYAWKTPRPNKAIVISKFLNIPLEDFLKDYKNSVDIITKGASEETPLEAETQAGS